MAIRTTLVVLVMGFACALVACGGAGSTAPSVPGSTTFPLPDDGPGFDPPGTPPGDGGGGGEPMFPELTGGVLVTVDTLGETWRWWVTNSATAALLERAWNGTYSDGFNARLRSGPGEAGHNEPWSWHADAEDNGGDLIFFQPPAPGSSPNTPSDCEDQLEHWLTKDTLFVPHYPFQILTFDDRRP